MKKSILSRVTIPSLIIVSMLLALLSACSSAPAATPTLTVILDSPTEAVTFDQVKQAIDNLYTQHPDISSYAVQGVSYNTQSRDKVLKICSEGGLVDTEQELHAQKVLACAPLIFYYYYYGEQKAVPESTALAQQLYWFALTDKPDNVKNVLDDLLHDWGIH